jgi:hypothetical protein
LTLVNSGGVNYVSVWTPIVNTSRTLTQTDSTRRPYYTISSFNNRPCVKFDHNNSDTTNDYLNGTNVGGFNAVNAQLHMFAACRQTSPTIRASTGDATENSMEIFGYEGFHGIISLGSSSSGTQVSVLSEWWNSTDTVSRSKGLAPISPYQKLMCFGSTIYGGTTGTWYVSIHSKNYVPSAESTTEASNRKTYASANCVVGCAKPAGGVYAYPLGGEIYEIILITGTITLNTKTKMLEYLNAKWGP